MPLKKLTGRKKVQYYFFSGKGGVGKTSMAASTALWFAEKGRRTLLISTDPAHSLSDSFETAIGGCVKQLRKNLSAVEIDPAKALNEYKEKFSPQIEKAGMLSSLGLDDVFDIAGMTPGIDEIAAFDKFLQYMHSEEYDVIIFDTAPTGHALRFLSLPDVLNSWVGKIIKIRARFAGVAGLVKKILPFGQSGESGEEGLGLEHLEAMKKRIESAKQILTNPALTHYNIVMIAEEMSIMESERAIKTLGEYGIPVETVIVNLLIPENSKCEFCTEKRKQQQERMQVIKKKFRKFRLLTVPMMKEEVKGTRMLEKVSGYLHK
jgi:arsenite-transporting ATPase